jgi:leader peptidase (prepilin peptidase)/N-methyltransferase
MAPSASSSLNPLSTAAILIFSLPVGWGLAGVVRRFDGAAGVSRRWMGGGAVTVAACSALTCSWTHSTYAYFFLDLSLGWALLSLAAIDATILRLPDVFTIPLAIVGLALAGPMAASFDERLAGVVLGVSSLAGVDRLYARLRHRTGLGLGDAKLFGAAGAWLGWRALPETLLIACGGGLAWIAVRILVRGRNTVTAPVPFGAPLCLAIWLVWLLETSPWP